MKRKRYPPKKIPPEGCMWDPLDPKRNYPLTAISIIESAARIRMDLWDSYRFGHKYYYKNDPAYWWCKKRGEK